MMDQAGIAHQFGSLHVSGSPVVLYNVWDAGGARVVADAGGLAVATGSWSMAAAHGYADGEAIPLDLVETIVRRIAMSVAIPVTVDFEGGYAIDPARAAANVSRIVRTGAVGINFEDGIVGGEGLHDVGLQCDRLRAIRAAADALGISLFINARTDLFLQGESGRHAASTHEAIGRAQAYASAGASGFFVPGLADERLIAAVCEASPLPVNVMMVEGGASRARLAAMGVARISYGPLPYRRLMRQLALAAADSLT